ncbi:MAG: MFS transporter [Chloroflexota bacterium]|nr:MFS transporter [Chloroflexota bacterium]
MLFSVFTPQTADEGSPNNHFFYGWVIAASCSLLLAVFMGISYSFGVFLTSLQEEFAWSRATASTVFSLYLLLSGVLAIIGRQIANIYGPRLVILVMGVISGLSLLLTSQVQSAWQLYFSYSLLLSIGTGAICIIVMSTTSRWCSRQEAIAVGIVRAGAGLGIAIMVHLSASLISAYDWRHAYLIVGIIAWAIIIPAALLLKKAPSNSKAYSDSNNQNISSKYLSTTEKALLSSETTKNRNLWLYPVMGLSYSFCLHLVMSHLVPQAQGIGMTLTHAASLLSVIPAISIVSLLITSHYVRKIDRKAAGIIMAMLHAITMFWLVDADNMLRLYVFAVFFGIAHGGVMSLAITTIRDKFLLSQKGTSPKGAIIGWSLGSAIGPYFGGLMFDITGNYHFAFYCGALMMVMASICIWKLQTHSQPPCESREQTNDKTLSNL